MLRTAIGDERRFIVRGPVTVIGRHATCDVRVPLACVAPRHCEIIRHPPESAAPTGDGSTSIHRLRIHPETPADGVIRINDRPLAPGEEHPIADLDRLSVGSLCLEFRSGRVSVEIETLRAGAPGSDRGHDDDDGLHRLGETPA